MKSRIVTALLIGGAAIVVVLWLPNRALAAVLGVVWLVGAHEWTRLAIGIRVPPFAYVAAVGVMMLCVYLLIDPADTVLVATVAAAWWVLAIVMLWLYPRRLNAAVVALSGPLTLIPSWILFVHVHGTGAQGPALALSLLIIIWAADVGAYFVGRCIGRVKLAPLVSPGKTWEGVLGGVIFATLAAVVAATALSTQTFTFIVIAIAATLVSVIGDLTVSMFKRNAGVKDSGYLLPGHGGVLDRIDSLSSAVPFFFIGLSLAGLQL